MKKISLLVLLFSLVAVPFAHAEDTPVGLWKNIDDKTGKPKALIRITESNGELQGKIEKLFLDDGADKNPKCDKCEGINKDQPVIGMTILYGLKKDNDEYNGGKIIDPANGKVYSSKLTLIDNNKKLNVRGYIGTPFLGRSQTWIREQ
ncbi:DUF2147 domain-containing protein [Undibacterium sp. CY7W]|uniref:DUF2147 domain-containing protein n=1 Tax=Undibacterium rugosum TaxID=2762291 RepID=A0A923I4B4_9BURK|nr:DUF2147 domain-containing protein [Undibacterium rugosum]MBC3935246.1 DUF2147 domain-containing protein [Undibacterium rugosum]